MILQIQASYAFRIDLFFFFLIFQLIKYSSELNYLSLWLTYAHVQALPPGAILPAASLLP